MATLLSKKAKPMIVQMFDKYVDREYSKVTPGFFFNSEVVVRADRINDWVVLEIFCENLPDKTFVNGEEYKLVKK